MSLQTVRSLYWQFRVFRPKLVVFDFDGTLTAKETISPLIELAQRHWTDSEFESFKEHVSWYSTNHQIYEDRLLENLRKYQQNTKEWNLQEVIPYFRECDALDQESLDKMNANGHYLCNIDLDELGDVFADYVRPEAVEQIEEFVNDGCRVKVLSMNWSSYAIHRALNGIIPMEDIWCNELESNINTKSTGKLKMQCVKSVDKMQKMEEWKKEYLHDDVDLCMYVGDAWGDCLASWTADLRVWMETDKNQHFLDVVREISP